MRTLATCAVADCPRWYPLHRWGRIRAQHDGWFEAKDGRTYCPAHVPEWVAAWRATRGGDP